MSQTTTFIKKGQLMPPHMSYPLFLLDLKLTETAKLVYLLLLNRSRLSARKPEFMDEEGNIFVLYSTGALAIDSRKSTASVRQALAQLEKEGLLLRRRQGSCLPWRSYVKLPELSACGGKKLTPPSDIFSSKNDEISSSDLQDPFSATDIFLSRIQYK